MKMMQGHTIRELTVENPMLVEITRFRRKFLSLGVQNASNLMAGIVLTFLVIVINLFVLSLRGSMPPVAIIYLQTTLYTIVIPATMYQAIAGEREKRTWDLLLVAPISKAQIVVGKFMASGAAVLSIAAILLIPTIFAGVLYERFSILAILTEEIVSIAFGLLVAAITIFFSARAKRGLIALGVTFGVLMLGLVFFPALLSSVGMGGNEIMPVMLFLHPFYTISQIDSPMMGAYMMVQPGVFGIPQPLTYLFLTIVMIAWATNTLVFAENEVPFLPKAKKHA
jgi:ABC-type transport system involved in multi-copper enzyme maturation permease subunit